MTLNVKGLSMFEDRRHISYRLDMCLDKPKNSYKSRPRQDGRAILTRDLTCDVNPNTLSLIHFAKLYNTVFHEFLNMSDTVTIDILACMAHRTTFDVVTRFNNQSGE